MEINQINQVSFSDLGAFAASAESFTQRLQQAGFNPLMCAKVLEQFPERKLFLFDSSSCACADSAANDMVAYSTLHKVPVLTFYRQIGISVESQDDSSYVGVFTPDQGSQGNSYYGARAESCQFCGSLFENVFEKAKLQNGTFTSPVIYRCSFRNADLRGVNFEKAVILCCDFTNAKTDKDTRGIPDIYLKQINGQPKWWQKLFFPSAA